MKEKHGLSLCILLSICLGTSVLSAGNTGKISGIITDVTDDSPLPGANVTVSGTERGTAADHNGEFTILNLPPGRYQLKFSMMGYQSVEVTQIRQGAGTRAKRDDRAAA